MQLTFFPPEPKPKGRLIFSITVPGRLPSWNEILGMEHWARYAYKKELADGFLSELQRRANDCSTKTTCAKNLWLIYAATLARYLETARRRRILRSGSKRPSPGKLRRSKSKSGKKFQPEGKVPF